MKASEMLIHTAGLVGGQRAEDYGDKTINHQRIANLWNYWLNERGSPSAITAYDAAMMMLMLKLARLMHSPGHQDSHVDIAGYASVLEEISTSIASETTT